MSVFGFAIREIYFQTVPYFNRYPFFPIDLTNIKNRGSHMNFLSDILI
jgi:hypothetical protein